MTYLRRGSSITLVFSFCCCCFCFCLLRSPQCCWSLSLFFALSLYHKGCPHSEATSDTLAHDRRIPDRRPETPHLHINSIPEADASGFNRFKPVLTSYRTWYLYIPFQLNLPMIPYMHSFVLISSPPCYH